MSTDPNPPESAPADYFYDAFISYRHVEPDRKWAQWLHRAMESYRMPRKLGEGSARKSRRVFRDEEELPASSDLNNEIETALKQSRFLIVVCSPRTPHSAWVNREVERFRELGRHDRILALLIEGEPGNAFPRSLREIRRTIVDGQGMNREEIELVEPLAADVRASRKEPGRYLRRMALLRMMACLLGCRFDDLRQREQERRQKQYVLSGTLLALLAIAMGTLAIIAVRKARLAETQRLEAVTQKHAADEQRQVAEVHLAQAEVAHGDTYLLVGRVPEARDLYKQSWAAFESAGASTLPAELGLWDAERQAASPSWTWAGGEDTPICVAISADGRRALTGNLQGSLKLFDLVAGKEIRSIDADQSTLISVAFSADGQTAICGGNGKSIRLWDLITGKRIRSIEGRSSTEGGVSGVTSVPGIAVDAPVVAATSVKTWSPPRVPRPGEENMKPGTDSEPPNPLHPYEPPNPEGHGSTVESAVLSTDGAAALSASSDDTLKLWDMKTGKLIRTLSAPGGEVLSGVFMPDGHGALSASEDGSLRLWNLTDGSITRTFTGHKAGVQSVAVSSDGATALTGSEDDTLKLWNLNTGQEIRTLTGHTGAVKSACVSRDGKTGLSAGDSTLRLWDLSSGQEVRTLRGHDGVVSAAAMSADGRTAVSCGEDGTLRLWDLGPNRELRTLTGHTAEVSCIDISTDGRLAISGGNDSTLKLWDVATGQLIRSMPCAGAVQSMALSPDAHTALCGTLGGKLTLFDLRTGRELPTELKSLELANGWITSITYLPDGRSALTTESTGNGNSPLRLWDLTTGKLLRTIPGHPNSIESAAITSDGRIAVSAGFDTMLKVWDLTTGAELRSLKSPKGFLYSVAIAPDGRTVLAGDSGGAITAWDLTTGQQLYALRSGHAGVKQLKITADGRTAMCADSQGMLTIWDLTERKELRAFRGDVGALNSVAIAGDGRHVVTGGADKTVKLWDFSRPVRRRQLVPQLARACAKLGQHPDDPAALAVLGQWYAFEGIPTQAIEFFKEAGAGGVPVSLLELAECFWEAGDLPTARAQFQIALDRSPDERERYYLELCRAAVASVVP